MSSTQKLFSSRNPNLSLSAFSLSSGENSVDEASDASWWTGLPPKDCPGFNIQQNCLQALPLLNLDICTRQDVLDYFNNTWTLTELLFQGLKTEDAFIRPPYHQLRHPLIFYYGHPAVLFINKLRLAGLVDKPVDIYLEKVLETGVDEMSWDDISKNEMIWPTVEEVKNYRKKVHRVTSDIIITYPEIEVRTKNRFTSNLWALWMGFEHEKIHFETSSVLIRELPLELVQQPKFWPGLHPSAHLKKNIFPKVGIDYQKSSWLQHHEQSVILGKAESDKSFGWDNEYGYRKLALKKFQVTETLISNGEFYEFVKSGDYSKDQYWYPEGLAWRKFRNTKRPTFWMASGPEGLHEYKLRTLFSVIAMPWEWPVEVNHHEAKAFCLWQQARDKTKLKYRLLTEGEHAVIQESSDDPVLQKTSYSQLNSSEKKSDSKNNDELNYNFNLIWSSPMPVDKTPRGNVWHLLEDQFNPLENFSSHPLYDNFSTPCFDGRHNMIAGGSFISCGHEASRWARFHFRPHFYQHSGFRMAATLDGSCDNNSFKFNETQEYTHHKRDSVLDQMLSPDWFKKIDQPLEPSKEALKNMFQSTQNKILNFYENYQNMKASGTAHDPQKNFVKDDFKVPYQVIKNFPQHGQHLSEQLKLIFDDLAPLSQLPGHPGYAAYVSGSANVYSNLAQLISQTLNPFTGHFMMAPGCVTLEAEAINWFLNLFNFPEKSSIGYFTSGGSQANLAALTLARKNILKSFDLSTGRTYASGQAHHCIAKALDFLGFPTTCLQKIPNQPDLKIDILKLELQIKADIKAGLKPFALVGTAGSTNTGAVDDLGQLAQLAKKYNLWFHVDGAYGALFMLTEKGRNVLRGIELADSIAFDPHKALCLPYGTGGLLIRDKNKVFYDFLSSTTYMPPAPVPEDSGIQVDYADLSVELSRDWRGLRVWLPIKTLGIGPFILNLEEKLALTHWLENEVGKIKGLKIFQPAQLTVLSFSVEGNSLEDANVKTQALLEKINLANTLFLSTCVIDDIKIIRICLLGHRLHFDRLEKFITQLNEFLL